MVLLYPNQDFRDITRAPNWVGALNDGKIRIPVSGLTQMTPDLARVLKHELTHSFYHLGTVDLYHGFTYYLESIFLLRYRNHSQEIVPYQTSKEFLSFIRRRNTEKPLPATVSVTPEAGAPAAPPPAAAEP